MNRPEVMNAMNAQLRYELSQSFDEVERNDDIWIAVLTGAGDHAFSSGVDLKQRSLSLEATPDQLHQWEEMRAATTNLTERWNFPKPVIAKVNGYALGGGMEIALACDIIVAAEHAEFGLPEPLRGRMAGWGGVHRLPRQIGLKPAMGYLLTGRHIPAPRAYELGLVNQVVPLAELDAAVDEWVSDIKRCAPLSLRATKEAATRSLEQPLRQAFYSEYEAVRNMRGSEDGKEGPLAFIEKREPKWKGR